jgi:C4-dicarboxylate-specific signal transduction histidine kinase
VEPPRLEEPNLNDSAITVVKRAQQEAAREQARFKLIFDSPPDGVTWMVTDKLETRIVNPAHARITGVPAAHGRELRRYRDATHPADRTAQEELHRRLASGLVRNARFACDESGRTDKQITVRTTSDERSGKIAIIDLDNGNGIPAENLTRIFNHGFTTKATGHGFGLHSGALAARDQGGSLTVQSDGPGRGAIFVLELSCPTG